MQLLYIAAAAMAAYLVGSLPTAVLTAKFAGARDPRLVGSGNAGATNTALSAGVPAGVVVFVLDFAKGLVATLAGAAYGGASTAAVCGLMAILGQVAPLYVGFRGGKGVATTLGAYAGLAPLAAAVGIELWLVYAFVLVRRFIPATLLALVSLSLGVTVMAAGGALILFAWGAVALSVWSHRHDLATLRNGRMPTVYGSLGDNRRE